MIINVNIHDGNMEHLLELLFIATWSTVSKALSALAPTSISQHHIELLCLKKNKVSERYCVNNDSMSSY